jgi:hypothetical protein
VARHRAQSRVFVLAQGSIATPPWLKSSVTPVRQMDETIPTQIDG